MKKSAKRTEPRPNSIQAVAREEGFSVSFLYKQIADGKLVARKAGARTIITPEDRAAWRESMPKIEPRAALTSVAAADATLVRNRPHRDQESGRTRKGPGAWRPSSPQPAAASRSLK
jgi:hypothetical protein